MGAAGAATQFLGRDAITPRRGDLFSDLLTTELIFRRHIIEIGQLTHFGLLSSSRSCLIGSDNSYHFCENFCLTTKVFSEHPVLFFYLLLQLKHAMVRDP